MHWILHTYRYSLKYLTGRRWFKKNEIIHAKLEKFYIVSNNFLIVNTKELIRLWQSFNKKPCLLKDRHTTHKLTKLLFYQWSDSGSTPINGTEWTVRQRNLLLFDMGILKGLLRFRMTSRLKILMTLVADWTRQVNLNLFSVKFWNFDSTRKVVWQTCWREIICTSVGNMVIWLSLTGLWPWSTVLAHCYHWICIFNTQILRDVCSYLEFTDNDLVFKILCKLQDGLKVTAHDATEALKQYRRFQGEIGRLQCTINRPCVSKLCRVLR